MNFSLHFAKWKIKILLFFQKRYNYLDFATLLPKFLVRHLNYVRNNVISYKNEIDVTHIEINMNFIAFFCKWMFCSSKIAKKCISNWEIWYMDIKLKNNNFFKFSQIVLKQMKWKQYFWQLMNDSDEVSFFLNSTRNPMSSLKNSATFIDDSVYSQCITIYREFGNRSMTHKICIILSSLL